MRKDVRRTRSRQRPQGWGSLLLAVMLLLVLAPLVAHAQPVDTVNGKGHTTSAAISVRGLVHGVDRATRS